jgi:CSLREA domain-containing protein
MTTKTNIREQGGNATKTRALTLLLLVLAAMAAGLLTPGRAQASAFPGANGKIVFASDRTTGTGVNNPEGDLEIFSMNPDGTAIKQLTKNSAMDVFPSYSADGKRIVFSSFRAGNSDIFVMNADGTGQKNLSKNPAAESRPAFSPDGKKVAYQRDVTANNSDIFVMNADGTGQTALTSDPAKDEDPTFSPKGDKIAFVSDRGFRGSEIFLMNADGTQQTNLTQKPDFSDEDPSFSPDGQQIAFASNRDGAGDSNDFDIFVMNADGTGSPNRPTSSRATDSNPAFSPDGKKIAFLSTRDGGDRDVFVMDTGGANQADVTPNDRTEFSPDWQPVAANFTVNTASDTGNGACDSNGCTLREAINASNAVLGQIPNTIRFDIPGGGVQTITPSSPLPPITRPVLVDGYTQPGATPNTLATGTNAALKIELNGVNTFGTGLAIAGTSDSVIRGLVINRFGQALGIFDDFSTTSDTSDNRIEGNFLGTDPTGKLGRGNDLGVRLDGGTGNIVGGTTPAARNLVSGNGEGIELSSGSQGNRMLGNLIGTTASGTAPLGNEFWGVAMFNGSTSNNKIGNGTPAGSNTIAFNNLDGIEVDFPDSATGNKISRNSIFSNGGLGIDLITGSETDDTNVPTPNDGDNPNTPQVDPDSDTGPNNLQNKPVLSSAKNTSTGSTIAGKLNSTASKTFKIEFFSNPSGTDEGKTFIGQRSVTTDASGNVSFTFSPANKVPAGQNITATATKTSTGDTSEFSAPKTVALTTGSDLSLETTKISGPSGVTKSPTAHFKFSSPDPKATFECSLDSGTYYECSSPETIHGLSDGRHVFAVRAVDEEGNVDPSPAAWIWSVDRNTR